ncbi:hypothetical protein AUJ14_03450 [Candidatus Micrarchaeota archaeon CG1_02_55_22]|nr:MAG: hypothetical protein AUJ14_03450 [Candidatus Micrarchaeota archaeon CG1_02_55_22]
MERLVLNVSGDVHGVGYRAHCKQLALSFGLAGFARNDDDGTVSIEVIGRPSQLDEFLEQLRATAPGSAAVEKISVKARGPAPVVPQGFKIM